MEGHGRSCAGRGCALVASSVCALALGLAACGSEQRADSGGSAAGYRVAVTEARFPREQRLADRARLVIAVRNTGTQTIPEIAVTLEGLERGEGVGAQEPIWVLESGPRGGVSAFANTWAKGKLPPGRTARFAWDVTAVEAGTHRLAYRVAANLEGDGRIRGEDGRAPAGELTVAVSGEPADARVDPETGAVVSRDDRDGP